MTTTSGHFPALGPWPARMANPIRDYDWGSTTQLARMQGRMPTGQPEAELWMGAHPSSPSCLIGLDGTAEPLDHLLQQHPQILLGADVLARHGARLPYLLKVLAIATPLSLQVHPDPARPRRGSPGVPASDGPGNTRTEPAGGDPGVPGSGRPGARATVDPTTGTTGTTGTTEETGIGDETGTGGTETDRTETDDRSPTYPDPYAKPELLYALRPVDAMCGFRHTADALDLLHRIDSPRLSPLIDILASPADPRHRLEKSFTQLVAWPEGDRRKLVDEVAGNARRLLQHLDDGEPLDPAHRRALMWVSRLATLHPTDPLVAAPLLLEVVQLDPGQTLFIPSGAPHAYLAGLGVEIMANSDNVLRAGLTHKPVAVEELLEAIDGQTRPIRDVPETRLGPYEVAWRPAVEEFQLSRLDLHHSTPIACYPRLRGPQILLCTSGTVGVATSSYALALRPGESAFVGASGGPITLAGPGEVFRAAVGEPRDA